MMISWGAAGLGKQFLGSAFGLALGVCQLPEDGAVIMNTMSGAACLRARASEDISVDVGSHQSPVKIAAGSASIGIHFSPIFAVQASGSIRGVSRFNGNSAGWSLLPNGVERRRDHVILRIGNSAVHPIRASLGEQRIPFGIDANPADDLWLVTEDRVFWGPVARSAVMTFDNMVETQLDIGMSADGPKKTSLPRISARLMYDLSFFERARLVASIADERGTRRYGFGFVSTSRAGDTSHFELARINASDPFLDAGFRLLFRFAFDASDRRWWLVYDEDRLRTQSFLFGYRYFFLEKFTGTADALGLRLSFGRVRSLNPLIKSKFLMALGVEANL